MARLRLRPSSREKELSTKGHEGRRRDTKGLEESQEGSAKGWEGGKDFQEGAKRYPRRDTKNGKGPRRGWRRLKKDLPKVGQGEKISRKGQKDIHEGPRRTAKGHEGVGGGSRGIRQRSPRGEKGFPGKGKKISTKDHEERRRATKGLEEAREGSQRSPRVEGRKDFQEKAKRFPRRTLGPSAKGTRIRELTRSKADKRSGRSRPAPGGSKTRTSPREGPLAVDRSASGDGRWRTSTSPRSPVGR